MRDETFSQLQRFRLIPFAQELRSHKSCAPTRSVLPQELCQPQDQLRKGATYVNLTRFASCIK